MRRDLFLSTIQRHLQMIVSVVSVMVLSRLIQPEEIGIYSIGVAIAALTHAVRDFGVGNFLIKETDITKPKVATAFTVSMIIAVVLSIVLVAIASPVAAFYKQPEVGIIIWITTAGLLISPFSTVNLALMLRDGRFPDMLKVSMAGALVNATVGIGLAWMGFGAKALALGALASSITLVIVSNLLTPERGIYRFSLSYWKQISQFGMHMTVFGLAEQLGGKASDLVVGKLVGFSAVGLLSRSGTLITMVQELVQNSVIPVILTNMASDTRKKGTVAPLLLQSLMYLSVVMWPVFAVIALSAHDAVLVLFGKKWIEAAPFTSMLCLSAAFTALSSLTGTICNATNRAELLPRYSVINQAIRIVLVTAGAMSGGLHAVVFMLVIAEMIQCGLAYYFIRQATGVSLGAIVSMCWRSVAVTAIVIAAVLPVQLLMPDPPLLRLVATGLAATVSWIAAAFIMRHPVAGELKILSLNLMGRLRAN